MFIGVEHLIFEWLKTRRGQVIGSVASAIVATAATMFLLPIGVRQVRLAWQHVIARADVIDTKEYFDVDHRERPRSIAVRYQFVVDGREYQYVGVGGNAFANVSVDVGETAARERKIDVAYWPNGPANNAPLVAMRWMWAWGSGFVVVPPVLAAMAWNWVTRVYRPRRVTGAIGD